MPMPVVVLVRDLLSLGPIRLATAGRPLPVVWLRDPAALAGVAEASRLIVDLNLPGAVEAVAEAKGRTPGMVVVGFVSHTDRDTIARARSAGVDQVLARSAFFKDPGSFLE